jgi:hypothetical protein
MATLKGWRLLRKLRCSTNRITAIVQAVLVLHHASAWGWKGLTIKAKTELLRSALTDAATLSDELQSELTASTTALQRIQQEAADYQRLAALDKEAADAVARALGKDAAHRDAKSNRKSVMWGLVWFLAGSAVTILATIFSGSLASLL